MKYHKIRASGFENRHGAEFRNCFLWNRTHECWTLMGGVYYHNYRYNQGSLKLRLTLQWKRYQYRASVHRQNWRGVEP